MPVVALVAPCGRQGIPFEERQGRKGAPLRSTALCSSAALRASSNSSSACCWPSSAASRWAFSSRTCSLRHRICSSTYRRGGGERVSSRDSSRSRSPHSLGPSQFP